MTLTPNQLAELKKGPKANIVIGPDGDRYIALESASVKLLAHFSPIAQKKLVDERGTILTIPNGSKKVMLWIYKYMQAGEHYPVGMDTFETLDFRTLIMIHQHCEFLGYKSLKKRVFRRLEGKFHNALPTVDEIELYQISIPELYEHALHCISREMVNPLTRNYGPYSRLAETNETFGKALGDAMDAMIASRVKAGEAYYQNTTNRDVVWAIKYIDAVLAGKVRPKRPVPKPANRAKQTANVAPGLFNKTRPGAIAPFECYACGNKGHIARNCTVVVKETTKREPPVCFKCTETGHIPRNCTKEKSVTGGTKDLQASSHARSKIESREPFICFNCGREGHMARECTVQGSDNRRNRHLREIEVKGNGEGLATCDREVRKGERTRTNLII